MIGCSKQRDPPSDPVRSTRMQANTRVACDRCRTVMHAGPVSIYNVKCSPVSNGACMREGSLCIDCPHIRLCPPMDSSTLAAALPTSWTWSPKRSCTMTFLNSCDHGGSRRYKHFELAMRPAGKQTNRSACSVIACSSTDLDLLVQPRNRHHGKALDGSGCMTPDFGMPQSHPTSKTNNR